MWAQNLGDAGSCMREFRPEIFAECTSKNPVCRKNKNAHSTQWLSASSLDPKMERVPFGQTLSHEESRQKYISRCVVCESIFKLVVKHSMNNEPPSCGISEFYKFQLERKSMPLSSSMDNYYPEAQDIAMDVIEDNLEIDLELAENPCANIDYAAGKPNPFYQGYSFWQISHKNFGIGTSSESASSCLTRFSPTPILVCNREGCRYPNKHINYWQMNTNEERTSNLVEFWESEKFASRCSVCRRPPAKYYKRNARGYY